MASFKEIAYEILKEAGEPLHSKEITKRALQRGLVTNGKTPEGTMNAVLVVDVNKKKEKSRFVKTGPSTYGINPKVSSVITKSSGYLVKAEDKKYRISKDVSSKQKGDIAEARVAELITLYGDAALSCYKPISDDEGIDLIVKEKGSLKTMYIQIKSRFGDDPGKIYTATTKTSNVPDVYSMAIVFCFFDTEEGDLWDYLWFVPATDFRRFANKLRVKGASVLSFVAGRKKNASNKWDAYMIDKRDLANQVLAQMKRLS